MALTDVQICSNACQRLGASSFTDFTDSGREPDLCNNLYPQVKNRLLASHNWHFASKRVQLSREAGTPPNRWTYQFLLPSDRIDGTPIEVQRTSGTNDRYFKVWEIVGDRLYSNVDELHVLYLHDADESLFPPYFTELLIKALMVELAMPLGNRDERQALWAEVYAPGGEFDKAKSAESRNHPARRYDDFSLIDAHGGEVPRYI